MTLTESILSVLKNKLFLSTGISWCVAQFIKTLLYVITHKHVKLSKAIETGVWRTGGMPSSHSAVACSLTTSVALVEPEGISSNLFIFSLFFALFVLRDSLGVRRASGIQAKAINSLGKLTSEKTGIEFNAIKEIEGHSPLEVVAGGILGIVFSICFYLFI